MLNSAAVGVNNVAAGGDVLGQARDEVVEGDCAEIQSAQAAYGDGAICFSLSPTTRMYGTFAGCAPGFYE